MVAVSTAGHGRPHEGAAAAALERFSPVGAVPGSGAGQLGATVVRIGVAVAPGPASARRWVVELVVVRIRFEAVEWVATVRTTAVVAVQAWHGEVLRSVRCRVGMWVGSTGH